jgi:hypothetical protein
MSYTPESINQLQARLNRLSPQQLKQFAATNYDDPISLALAMQVDSERKKMTAQSQAMAAGQQKPPVAAQAIQSMGEPMPNQAQTQLPENTGIAQLPTPNIQSMADGGIAGYDMEPVVRMADGGSPFGRWWESVTQDFRSNREGNALRKELAEKYAPTGGLQGLFKNQTDEERAIAERTLSIIPKLNKEQLALLKEQGVSALPTLETALAPPPKTTTPAPASAAASTAPASTTQVLQPDTKTLDTPPPPKPRAPAASAAPANSGIAALALTPEALAKDRAAISATQNLDIPAPLKEAMGDVASAENAAAQRRLAELEADITKRGPAFADREARLKAREAEFGQQKEDNKSMALLEAGLAIMSGSSPYALQNIGAGALVGTKSYKAGLKDLAEVRDKLDDAFGRIEEYRRTEGAMNDKERRAAKADIDKTVIDAKKTGVAALTDKWKLNEQQANSMLTQLADNRKSVYEQGEATKRTAMTVAAQREATAANMLPGEARVAMILGTGKTEAARLQSGLSELNSIKDRLTESKLAELYVKHKKEAEALMQPVMSPTEFAKVIRAAVSAYNPQVVDTGNAQPGNIRPR